MTLLGPRRHPCGVYQTGLAGFHYDDRTDWSDGAVDPNGLLVAVRRGGDRRTLAAKFIHAKLKNQRGQWVIALRQSQLRARKSSCEHSQMSPAVT